jgi:hypothetical protein
VEEIDFAIAYPGEGVGRAKPRQRLDLELDRPREIPAER